MPDDEVTTRSECDELSSSRRLEVALIEGLDSGHPIEITDAWWSRKREELAARQNGKRKQKRKTPKASKSKR